MSDFEELDPSIHNALRDVPPASASLRDAHIAAALGEIAPSSRRAPGRLRILGSVAAATVLAVAGLSVVRQNAADNNQVSVNSTLPPKTGANECNWSYGGGDVAETKKFINNNSEYLLYRRDDVIDVYLYAPPCSMIGSLEFFGAQQKRDQEVPGSVDSTECKFAAESIISQFTDSANGDQYSFVLVNGEGVLDLYFADRCDSPIATLDLP